MKKRKLRSDAALRRTKCIDLAERGKTVREISKALKLTTDTVYRHLASSGVAAVTPPRKSPLCNRERVAAMVARHGVAEAAKSLGVTRQAIYWRLARWAAPA